MLRLKPRPTKLDRKDVKTAPVPGLRERCGTRRARDEKDPRTSEPLAILRACGKIEDSDL